VKQLDPGPDAQAGSATLLIALVLMMSITIGTLSVARTLVVEQRMASNANGNTRLLLQAERGLAKGIVYLTHSLQTMSWQQATNNNTLVEKITVASAEPDIQTHVIFSRPADAVQYISIQATSSRDDGSALQAVVSQTVRPLSVLTPLAESAPPLVVNGCPTAIAISFDIRPLDADSDQAGDSVWLYGTSACSTLHLIDSHNGLIRTRATTDDLWSLFFSVSREEFTSLASEQDWLAESDRDYWLAQDGDMNSGRWQRSLGSAGRPVALYFPAAAGCPEFSDGVRLFGLVFIDADCAEPVAAHSLEVFGTLIVNGNLNAGDTRLRLSHIQRADSRQTRLRFPLLRSIPVPGTWKDF